MKKLIIILVLVSALLGYQTLIAGGPIFFPNLSDTIAGYLSTVSSNVQDQIDSKAATTVVTDSLGAAYDSNAELKALMPITQTISLADTDVLTPTAGYKWIDINATCTTNPTSTITVAETGAIETATMRFRNVGTYACAIVYAANNFEHKGGTGKTMTINAGDSFEAKYSVTLSKWTVTVNQTSTTWQSQVAVQNAQRADPDNVTFSGGAAILFGGTGIATATGTYAHSDVVVSGENFSLESHTAAEVAMTVNGSDTTWYNGVSCGAGKGIDSDASVAAFVACQYGGEANIINCRGVSWNCTP